VGRPLALPPAALSARLALQVADPRFAGDLVGVSVWMDGYGSVATTNQDLALLPASNQKLLTALGALELFPPTTTFSTVVAASGPLLDGVVQGDLVLVGGGDATLAKEGPLAQATLAEQLAPPGVGGVAGSDVADESGLP